METRNGLSGPTYIFFSGTPGTLFINESIDR